MASGHANRTKRPNTWPHRPTCDVKKVLANSEPSTHGTDRHAGDVRDYGESWRVSGPFSDIGNLALMIQPVIVRALGNSLSLFRAST